MTHWVSILTPIYNGIEFLEQCAMSVCLQECSHLDIHFTWEWLIGINGHGDGGDVLQKAIHVQKKCIGHIGDCAIHVINLPNARGKADALNALKERAIGEWVAILDCDDTWQREKLLFQRVTIDTIPDIQVVGTFCKYFGELQTNGPSLPVGRISQSKFWESNPIINSSVLIRKELANWEDRFGLDDYDLWLRLIKRGVKFFNVPEYLVYHRIHSGSFFNGKEQDVNGLLAYHSKNRGFNLSTLRYI
ncbi:glycosyltransferase [bacterium]|nr:glycosyltransferase [bacterium]